jgi:HEAT repeat protein
MTKDPAVALQAAELLVEDPARAKAAGGSLVAPLEALLGDPAKPARLRAAALLGSLGAPGAPALIRALKDADRDVRIAAADGLGRIGPGAKAAVSALAEAVAKDPSGTVRMRSADALARLGPDAKSALPSLEAAIKDPAMAQRPEVLAKLREVHAQLR